MHGTLRFLFLSHLLHGKCVKIFIMNRYISTDQEWPPRILFTDNIQNRGSCGVNYTLGTRGFSCAVFGFGQVLKKVIGAIDRLETRPRSIQHGQHGKSRRSAPEVFSRGFATRIFVLRQARRVGLPQRNLLVARNKKSSGTRGMSTITSVNNSSNT